MCVCVYVFVCLSVCLSISLLFSYFLFCFSPLSSPSSFSPLSSPSSFSLFHLSSDPYITLGMVYADKGDKTLALRFKVSRLR